LIKKKKNLHYTTQTSAMLKKSGEKEKSATDRKREEKKTEDHLLPEQQGCGWCGVKTTRHWASSSRGSKQNDLLHRQSTR
jgi:hypothetical protein